MPQQEDNHFLIDNAFPKEVAYTLRCLSSQEALSANHLRARLASDFGYEAQKNLSFSTRRLIDLGLAVQQANSEGKPGYVITPLGERIRSILYDSPELYADLMHFLHYNGDPSLRKLFLSYRWCCNIVWDQKEMVDTSAIVAEVQSRIAERYPGMYAQRIGGNFNAGGVTSWKAWVVALTPPPFDRANPRERSLLPRTSDRYELVLLALDHVYCARGYRYGDPVILDDALLDEIARVSFLDPLCCRNLLDLAARVTRVIALRDTFAGTSIKLLAPYGVQNL